MSKIFEKYCDSAVESINAEYNKSKIINNLATAGAVREEQIKELLAKHLPEWIHVVSGQVIDSKDSTSLQQDIVLVHKSMPRLPFANEIDLIFIEGVIATFEIKSNVRDRRTIQNIGQNFKSIRALKSEIIGHTTIGANHKWPADKVLCALITYSGRYINNEPYTSDLSDDEKPDLLLDLSRGLWVINNGTISNIDNQSGAYIEVSGAGKGLAQFLIYLTEITGVLMARTVDLRKYC